MQTLIRHNSFAEWSLDDAAQLGTTLQFERRLLRQLPAAEDVVAASHCLAVGRHLLGARLITDAAHEAQGSEVAWVLELWAAQGWRLAGQARRAAEHAQRAVSLSSGLGPGPQALADLTMSALLTRDGARRELPKILARLRDQGLSRGAARALMLQADLGPTEERTELLFTALLEDADWSVPPVMLARQQLVQGNADGARRIIREALGDRTGSSLELELEVVEAMSGRPADELATVARLRALPMWGLPDGGGLEADVEGASWSDASVVRASAAWAALRLGRDGEAARLLESIAAADDAALGPNLRAWSESATRSLQSVQGASADDALRGRLEHVPVPTLLGLVDQNETTGALVVEHGGQRVTLWLDEGRLVDAASLDDDGSGRSQERILRTVMTVISWPSGSFRLLPWSQPARSGDETVSVQMALMEAARRLDEGPDRRPS